MAAILVMLPGPDFALIAKISLMNGVHRDRPPQ